MNLLWHTLFFKLKENTLSKYHRNVVISQTFPHNRKYMIPTDIHRCVIHEISHVSLNTRGTDRVIFMGIFRWIFLHD